jgi:hypothetical protein
MIELIFSIVILAISVSTMMYFIPNAQASNTLSSISRMFYNNVNIILDISNKFWDYSIYNIDPNATEYSCIDVSNGDTLLVRNLSTNYRVGHTQNPEYKGRKFYSTTTNATINFARNARDTAIEDFEGFTFVDTNSSTSFSANIRYVDDTCIRTGNNENCSWSFVGGYTNQSTNIKRVKLTSNIHIDGQDYNHTLYYFSSNIGKSTLDDKSW